MGSRKHWLCVGLVMLCACTCLSVFAQLDPGVRPFRILQFVDESGFRLGIVIVVADSGRGYEENHEYWRFDEVALIDIEARDALQISIWAEGGRDDPQVVEALSWYPASRGVEWVHPTEVEWTSFEGEEPPAGEEGIYFGNNEIGGLSFEHSFEDASSLTWFKLTEGDFMQLKDGAVLYRQDPPTTGSWWSGVID